MPNDEDDVDDDDEEEEEEQGALDLPFVDDPLVDDNIGEGKLRTADSAEVAAGGDEICSVKRKKKNCNKIERLNCMISQRKEKEITCINIIS